MKNEKPWKIEGKRTFHTLLFNPRKTKGPEGVPSPPLRKRLYSKGIWLFWAHFFKASLLKKWARTFNCLVQKRFEKMPKQGHKNVKILFFVY